MVLAIVAGGRAAKTRVTVLLKDGVWWLGGACFRRLGVVRCWLDCLVLVVVTDLRAA